MTFDLGIHMKEYNEAPITIEELQTRIHWVINDLTSLTEFKEWFYPAAWNLAESDQCYQAAGEIKLLLAEHSCDDDPIAETHIKSLLASATFYK